MKNLLNDKELNILQSFYHDEEGIPQNLNIEKINHAIFYIKNNKGNYSNDKKIIKILTKLLKILQN